MALKYSHSRQNIFTTFLILIWRFVDFLRIKTQTIGLKDLRVNIHYIDHTFELWIELFGQLEDGCTPKDLAQIYAFIFKAIFCTIPRSTLVASKKEFDGRLKDGELSHSFAVPGKCVVLQPLDAQHALGLYAFQFANDSKRPRQQDEPRKATPESQQPQIDQSEVQGGPYIYTEVGLEPRLPCAACAPEVPIEGKFTLDNVVAWVNGSACTHCEHRGFSRVFRDRLVPPDNNGGRDNTLDFETLHRRIQFFLHLFIEVASDIQIDRRWLVFIPVLFTRDELINGYHKQDSISDTLTSINALREHAANTRADFQLEKLLQDASVPSQEQTSGYKHACIIGMATVYRFFTLNKDRWRISQFLILPSHARKGFGLKILSWIYKMAIFDHRVRQVTVEDPVNAFMTLRLVTVFKLLLESGQISPCALYPPSDTSCQQDLKTGHVHAPQEISKLVTSFVKETKHTANRYVV
ncbi:bifunctional Acyl-CoA N-acyltransferase/Histone acetyltransferase type B [Babesia duncani]|uniref:Bifunctional Acyl-CoA N-acyltransferase/Histone acetyltransferase type B n=1 Tax=Babesia duncani TaxID=323732 RepID=A0AAD9PP70_9APIC|nr:bifunctional Acyl-CoA N-acyltransferase/Histone acetyltransferase type B [Babesia duncani]